MTHTYNISGMACKSCVANVKNALQKIDGIESAEIQLNTPQATIRMARHIALPELQQALKFAGKYAISETGHQTINTGNSNSWLETYKPVLLLFSYIIILSVLLSVSYNGFQIMNATRFFMSGFFLAFSFFKMLNLKGFADSYSSYDIIAKRFHAWGFIYVFIELFLGLSFALNISAFATNLITFSIMSVSITGVLQSVFNKRKIQCACLGTVFNLPMSTITIIEDALMILMSAAMLFIS
ncbi:MAG TPA: cation transporter [Arachidicoccus sp.]